MPEFNRNDYYSIAELVGMAGISRQHLHKRFTQRGEAPQMIKHYIGKRPYVLIPTEDGDKWLTRYWVQKAFRDSFAKRRPTATTTTGEQNHAY